MHFKIKFILMILLMVNMLNASEQDIKKERKMSIESNWNKLIGYWKEKNSTIFKESFQCIGATDIEINKLKELYEEIPDLYIRSLKVCGMSQNKKGEYYYFIDKSGWGQLYGINDVIKITYDFRKKEIFYKDGAFEYIYGDVKNPQYDIPKQWIPIYDWNTDYTIAIDMLSKNKGQVIVFCLEDSTLAKWTDSYEEWFELAVNEVLQYGELRVETIEKVLQKAVQK